MDKYEFNIKVEQIKKLVNKGDYETAMKIADTIDWRRVRSTSLLTMVAQVYERNEEYQDAKDILLLAFERAPIGKGLLFKLTDLALREKNIPEAEAYYREFCDLSADDPRQNLLRYLILEAKEAPKEQLLNSLERYCDEELDEKWLYRLAELYQEAGREEDCVRICDKIMLMFGLGKYVDKAMELKLQHAPLTKYQMDLVENREKYEEKLRAVEQRYSMNPRRSAAEEDFDEPDDEAEPDTYGRGASRMGDSQMDDSQMDDSGMEDLEDDGSLEEKLFAKMHEAEAEEDLAKEMSRFEPYIEENESSSFDETRILSDLRHIKQLRPNDFAEKGSAAENAAAESAATESAATESAAAEMAEEDTIVEDWDLESEEEQRIHLMIEAEDAAAGLNLALDSLKKLHIELGSKNAVAKISGENLNKKGVFAVADRLAGKDLIIERAADLDYSTVSELSKLMDLNKTGMIVVLIDAPVRMEGLHNNNIELAGKFQYIGCDRIEAEVYPAMQPDYQIPQQEREAEARRRRLAEQEAARNQEAEAARFREEARVSEEARIREEESRWSAARENDEASRLQAEYEAEYAAKIEAERAADEAMHQAQYENTLTRNTEDRDEIRYQTKYEDGEAEETEVSLEGEPEDDHGMDVEEFAQYACKYAAEIDCSISGKSMLALYERAEMMEEDGIPLTKANAEELLEEAADKAEKHSFGGLFSSKYDKDGLLVLKEKHFFD